MTLVSSRTKVGLKCFTINLILRAMFSSLMPFHLRGMSVTACTLEWWCVFLTLVVGFIPELVLDNCRGGLINDSCWELVRTFEVCSNPTEQSSRLLEDRNCEQHQKSTDVTWTRLTTSYWKKRAEVDTKFLCASVKVVSLSSTATVASVCLALHVGESKNALWFKMLIWTFTVTLL